MYHNKKPIKLENNLFLIDISDQVFGIYDDYISGTYYMFNKELYTFEKALEEFKKSLNET